MKKLALALIVACLFVGCETLEVRGGATGVAQQTAEYTAANPVPGAPDEEGVPTPAGIPDWAQWLTGLVTVIVGSEGTRRGYNFVQARRAANRNNLGNMDPKEFAKLE